jgi:hypothetical protein
MPDHLSPHMLSALRDIAERRCGTIARTERALRTRGLIQSSEEWPFVEPTPAGLEALAAER